VTELEAVTGVGAETEFEAETGVGAEVEVEAEAEVVLFVTLATFETAIENEIVIGAVVVRWDLVVFVAVGVETEFEITALIEVEIVFANVTVAEVRIDFELAVDGVATEEMARRRKRATSPHLSRAQSYAQQLAHCQTQQLHVRTSRLVSLEKTTQD
jgi:hypothetical protein